MAYSFSHDYSKIQVSDHGRLHAGDVHHHYPNPQVVDEDENTKKLLGDILTWLNAPDSTADHRAARDRREPGTGDWFLGGSWYHDWRLAKEPKLWLHGKAGCCKSTLCSGIIQDVNNRLQEAEPQGSVKVVYFYFSFSDMNRQSWRSVLLSLIVQLARGMVPIVPELKDVYWLKQGHSDDLELVLHALLGQQTHTFLVLDALDECPARDGERVEVMKGLKRMTDHYPNNRLLVTSRKEADIESFMADYSSTCFAIEDLDVDSDIRLYLAAELRRDRKLKALPQVTKDLVKTTIAERAGGMFRYAYLQLNEIKRLDFLRPQHIADALQRLPDSLDGTYDRTLLNIADGFDEAHSALQWLALSQRPLSPSELVEACITSHCPEPLVDEASRDAVWQGIQETLAPLIIITDPRESYSQSDIDDDSDIEDGNDRRVIRLSHFSVKEYLASHRILQGPASRFHIQDELAHHHLAQCCIAYLIHWGQKSTAEGDGLPLVKYAAEFWPKHQSYAETDATAKQTLGLQLNLLVEPALRINWLFASPIEDFDKWADVDADTCYTIALFWAARCNLPHSTAYLCTHVNDISARGSRYGNALHAAAGSGNVKVCKLLIEAGADVNVLHAGCTALGRAAQSNHLACVELLLERGAHVSFHGSVNSPLAAAIQHDHERVVQRLLKAGANPNAYTMWYRGTTILQEAAAKGLESIVKLLLSAGADVNARAGHYGTALNACLNPINEQLSTNLVSTLLQAGASIGTLPAPLKVHDHEMAEILQQYRARALYIGRVQITDVKGRPLIRRVGGSKRPVDLNQGRVVNVKRELQQAQSSDEVSVLLAIDERHDNELKTFRRRTPHGL